MTEKCYKLYGTKILNLQTQEIGLLICLWKNKFADGDIDFATCVNKQGKTYCFAIYRHIFWDMYL